MSHFITMKTNMREEDIVLSERLKSALAGYAGIQSLVLKSFPIFGEWWSIVFHIKLFICCIMLKSSFSLSLILTECRYIGKNELRNSLYNEYYYLFDV